MHACMNTYNDMCVCVCVFVFEMCERKRDREREKERQRLQVRESDGYRGIVGEILKNQSRVTRVIHRKFGI